MSEAEQERPTILVVDDEEADRTSMCVFLERAGYRALSAASGHEALSIFVEESVLAVVTDVVMTDGDGVSLIGWLKSLSPTTGIIAVSGKGETGLRAAKIVGARVTLSKPIDADELVDAVRQVDRP